ncbi:DNA polymerase [Aphelenchoides fujianensis]|nr:DNA polymerase [Aphelenchoides fujianensis]
MDSLADAMVAFDVYEGFKFECPECDKPVVVRSTFAPEKTNMSFALESCPECQADLSDHFDHLQSPPAAAAERGGQAVRRLQVVCEDPTCGYREEEPLGLSWASSQGPACPQCKAAVMRKEFSLKDLFYQQKFYKSIFDWKACLKNFCSEEQRKAARNRVTFNSVARFYDQCEASVLQHLNANRYNRVQLDGLLRGFRISS